LAGVTTMQLIAVATGGALGALARHTVYTFMPVPAGTLLPWPTLTVNVLGSFVAGLVLVLLTQAHPGAIGWRLLLGVGFLGAFTTFSAFSVDSWLLLEAGRWQAALANALLNVSLSVGACVAAVLLARSFSR
jgi:CrcB protein